jgi:hypothetical protein
MISISFITDDAEKDVELQNGSINHLLDDMNTGFLVITLIKVFISRKSLEADLSRRRQSRA